MRVPVVPEFLLCEAVQVGNVWPRLRVQVPLLAVGRAAGYAGQCLYVRGDILYVQCTPCSFKWIGRERKWETENGAQIPPIY